MALLVEQWSTTPGLNSDPPPNGAPEGTMKVEELNDTMRVMMAAQRETFDGNIQVYDKMPGGATLESPAVLPNASWVGPRNYIDGLGTEWVDAKRIQFNQGEAQSSDNTVIFNTSSSVIKTINLAWAEGNGGGLAAGVTFADGWFHCFVLFNPTTGTVDAGFDTNFNASNLMVDVNVVAAGYTKFRRVHSALVISSDIARYLQDGDEVVWYDRILDYNLVSQNVTPINRVHSIPPGLRCRAVLSVQINQASATPSLWVYCPDTNDGGKFITATTSLLQPGYIEVLSDKLSQVTYRSDGPCNLTVSAVGYVDRRGKDSA